MTRRLKQVFGFLICFVVLVNVYFYPEEYLKKFNQIQKIIDKSTGTTISDNSKFIKVPYDQNVAMNHTKERMKLPTFDCRPITGGGKLFNVEYDLKNGYTNIEININVVKDYFKSSSSIKCSLQKFDKKYDASELDNQGKRIILDSKNKYQAKVTGYGFYYLNCHKSKNSKRKIFDDIITILPRDLSKLPDPKIGIKPETSIQSKTNPLYSDRNLYDACEVPEEKRNPKKMNVLIIQIDSMSYNHFRRMFPDTFEFLSKSLPNNRLFENFMIVGENTRPNTFPWLGNVISTKMAELNIEGENSVYSSDYSNKFPFIWKDFQKLGHVTMYNKDFQINDIFEIRSSGLKQSPANFYNFPYWEKFRSLKMQSKFCLNGHLVSDIYMDQVNQFVEAMNLDENKGRSYFSANQFAMMTHDQFEGAPEFDKSLKKQLKEFSEKGYLKETFLIIKGDHGGRPYAYGDQVMLDFAEREYPYPFLSIKVPDSMVKSSYYENFMKNSDKLVTPHDLYKTMKHLYYISKNGLQIATEKCRKIMTTSEPMIRGLRGLSLFESLPSKRSCIEALIPLAFCTHRNKTEIDPHGFKSETKKTVKQLADFLQVKIVEATHSLRRKCQKYDFDQILHIKSILSGNLKYYEVKISLNPGPSHFKGIVKIFKKQFRLVTKINRENKYGDQPKCLIKKREQNLKPFCYCKNS